VVRRVCVRVCSATVVNYEYLFYWYLYQDGTIQVSTRMHLSLVLAPR
jgi:Cu2+-containing amine oxidase